MASFDELSYQGATYHLAPIYNYKELDKLPFSLRILLENCVRSALQEKTHNKEEIATILERKTGEEITFYPARIFSHDILGLVMLLDMVALREAVLEAGGDASTVNPSVPVELVVDHSVQVDSWANPRAAEINLAKEYERNRERFEFLRWCGVNFTNVSIIPPGKGIMHQLHLEHFGRVVYTDTNDKSEQTFLYPDSCIGTDSHTPMINGIGILGWGVGGIEAEAVSMGLPVSIPLPEVVGIKLENSLPDGVLPTDLVLVITKKMRELGVVGKFIEFFGEGLNQLSVGDRGMIANMAPEYGATAVFFPTDQQTLDYMYMTGRDESELALIKAYNQKQKLWRDASTPDPDFNEVVTIDLAAIRPSLSGPSNPEDQFDLKGADQEFKEHHQAIAGRAVDLSQQYPVEGESFTLHDGAVVIAAITSCTNTANPVNMIAAGLVAENAVKKGLRAKPWVKTSLVPGSQVTADILKKAGLQDSLDLLGFNIAGFGCTTCNGGSGPLPLAIEKSVADNDIVATAVLSGNRNFAGRIHKSVRANYLASPALVVIYAITGTLNFDVDNDPLGYDENNQPVYLKDIWPKAETIHSLVQSTYERALFIERYKEIFDGGKEWENLTSDEKSEVFHWDEKSLYIKNPPYFDGLPSAPPPPTDIENLRPLAILGDSITTDHISPSGGIMVDSPAGQYLMAHGVEPKDFNNYTTRRANHEVVKRATFANIRLRNKMLPEVEGGFTKVMPEGEVKDIFAATQIYQERGQELIVIAGKNYGCGSSRDSAAKCMALLGVKAIVAESFERIHRTNLLGMGILPLELAKSVRVSDLSLDGSEVFAIRGLAGNELTVRQPLTLNITRQDGTEETVPLITRLDTHEEVEYWRHGGILPRIWRDYLNE